MNIITKSNLEKFRTEFGFSTNIKECDLYEYYVTYCVMQRDFTNETIERAILETTNTGNGDDWGIDGFILTLNGRLIVSAAELQNYIDFNADIRVHIGLVQAKTSSKFELAEIQKILTGVDNIIDMLNGTELSNLPPANEKLCNYLDILKKIYQNNALFQDGNNPMLDVYYVADGDFIDNTSYKSMYNRAIGKAKSKSFFSRYDIHTIDSPKLASIAKSIMFGRKATLTIGNIFPLQKINGIDTSYVCMLPFPELKKILLDENGKLDRNLFYDNVRDYQGKSPVNISMAKSIKTNQQSLFAVLNNGITIIAKSIRPVGNEYEITDFQVVNGCQTCNVLYNCMCEGTSIDELSIITKLIASDNKDLRDAIIVANNNQTEVKQEQLVSLLDTQKRIEDYYNAQTKFTRLYYERRSRQYRYGDRKVSQDSIVTIGSQVRSFASMILSEPHNVNGYYGQIVQDFNSNGKNLFDKCHYSGYYYLSALGWHVLSRLLSDGDINSKYKRMPYHLLLAFRLVTEPYTIKQNDNKAETYVNSLCCILCDATKAKEKFTEAAKIVDRAVGLMPANSRNNLNQSSHLTENIIRIVAQMKNGTLIDNATETSQPEKANKTTIPGLKIVGKIDLDALNAKYQPKRIK